MIICYRSLRIDNVNVVNKVGSCEMQLGIANLDTPKYAERRVATERQICKENAHLTPGGTF